MSKLTRRTFFAKSAAAGTVAGLLGFGGYHVNAAEPLVTGMPNTEELGWRVGFSAYSFRSVTLFEALDKMAATGLHYTELFAWQKLSPTNPDAKPGPELSKTLRKDLKSKASDCGVNMIGCYTNLDKSAIGLRNVAMSNEVMNSYNSF